MVNWALNGSVNINNHDFSLKYGIILDNRCFTKESVCGHIERRFINSDHKSTFKCSKGSTFDHHLDKNSRKPAAAHVSMILAVTKGLILFASAVSRQKSLWQAKPHLCRPLLDVFWHNIRLVMEMLLHCSVEDVRDDSPLTTPSLMASRPQLRQFCSLECTVWLEFRVCTTLFFTLP